MMMVMMLCF